MYVAQWYILSTCLRTRFVSKSKKATKRLKLYFNKLSVS